MVDVTDDFNRANGLLGANWTTSTDLATAGSGQMQIISNHAESSPTSTFFASFYSAQNFADDQYAQAVVLGAGGQGAGVVVRHQGSARSSFYSFFANLGAGADAFYIRWDNGSVNILHTFSGQAVPSGATIRLRVTGNILTASVNGVDLATQTDSTYTSGFPGVVGFNATLDDFLGGPAGAAATLMGAMWQ